MQVVVLDALDRPRDGVTDQVGNGPRIAIVAGASVVNRLTGSEDENLLLPGDMNAAPSVGTDPRKPGVETTFEAVVVESNTPEAPAERAAKWCF